MLSTVEKVLCLKSVELFSKLTGEALAKVALIAKQETRDTGDEIFTEGEAGDALYLILTGRVRLQSEGQDVVELGPRCCFGEMEILEPAPRTTTATALERLEVLRISREDFQELLTEEPGIAAGVIRVLAGRLRLLERPG